MLILVTFSYETPKREKKLRGPFFLAHLHLVCFRVLMRINSGSQSKIKFINGKFFFCFHSFRIVAQRSLVSTRSIYLQRHIKINNHKNS